MEEQQDIRKLKIGTEEAVSLKPAVVKIESVLVEDIEVKGKKNKKVVCGVKHPDTTEPVHLSSVKFESKGKLVTTGLWVNFDSKGLIRKGSALAVLLNFLKAEDVEGLQGKEIQTALDDKNYLCFKAY
jgi:hypothetical protein